MQSGCISPKNTSEILEEKLQENRTVLPDEEYLLFYSSTYDIPESLPPAYEMTPLPPAMALRTTHTWDSLYWSIYRKADIRSIIHMNNTSYINYGSKPEMGDF
jgi:hypothetical protein